MKKLVEEKIRECRFSTPSEYSARSCGTARIMMGSNHVALVISRGVPVGVATYHGPLPRDSPSVEMKEP